MIRLAAAAAAVLLALGVAAPAHAQAIPASGFTANGTIAVQANLGSVPLALAGPVGVERRDAAYRFQLRDVQFPGLDPTLSAALGAVLSQGTITLVYDGETGTTRAWSSASRSFYTSDANAPARPLPRRDVTAVAPSDPLAFLAAITRASATLQAATFTVHLTGHAQVNGHPASLMGVDVRRTPIGGTEEAIRGDFAFADDLGGLPLRMQFAETAGKLAGDTATIDLTTVTQDVPDANDFRIPEGYRRVPSLTELLRPPGL